MTDQRARTALITGQQLLYWSVMIVVEDAPLMEGRPLMQLCAALCRPLRKEEATCAKQQSFKSICCRACSERCSPDHRHAGDMQKGTAEICAAWLPAHHSYISRQEKEIHCLIQIRQKTEHSTHGCGVAIGVLRSAEGLNKGQGGVIGLRAGQVASDGAIARVEKASQAIHHLHNVSHST